MKEEHQQRPIVCGTDFSALATEAVDVAAAMARRLGTKLVLAHAEEFSGMVQVDPGLFKEALSQQRGDLEKEAARLRDLGTDVEIKLLSGSVFDELVTAVVACKGAHHGGRSVGPWTRATVARRQRGRANGGDFTASHSCRASRLPARFVGPR